MDWAEPNLNKTVGNYLPNITKIDLFRLTAFAPLAQLAGTLGFWHNLAHGMEGLAAILGIILPGIM